MEPKFKIGELVFYSGDANSEKAFGHIIDIMAINQNIYSTIPFVVYKLKERPDIWIMEHALKSAEQLNKSIVSTL